MRLLRRRVNDPSPVNIAPAASETSTISADEEIRRVASAWVIKTHHDCSRILFYPKEDDLDSDSATYAHPLLGNLPDPWELHKRDGGRFIYFNTNTLEEVTRGPRKVPSRR